MLRGFLLFFGLFLKGDDTGWVNQPTVELIVRHLDEKFIVRGEDEWPIARTEWTKVYLDPNTLCLSHSPLIKNSSLKLNLWFSPPPILTAYF